MIVYPEGKVDETYTIPNAVTIIGDSAFYRCNVIKKVIIQNGVTKIGNYAFQWCATLTNVETVTSIGDRAFDVCKSLESITIPDSVTSIGDYAFNFCQALENIEIPDSVVTMEKYVFEYCSLLKTKVYYVTNSLTNIFSSNDKNYVIEDTEYYTTTLSANDGYKLPQTITVKVGDKELDSAGIYDASTGKV